MLFGLRETKKLLAVKRLNVAEPALGQDYRALVSAQSRALEKLSREIAETIKTLPK